MRGTISEIDHKTAIDFLMPRHYSGRKPNITTAYGWFSGSRLVAVISFGKPASPFVCEGICGKEYSKSVYELNRLCREDDWNEPLSCFVCAVLRRLRCMNWIVVAYSDMAMNHHGYIYQASNFMYLGCSKSRTDKYVDGYHHPRHYKKRVAERNKDIQVGKAPICCVLHFQQKTQERVEKCITISSSSISKRRQ